MIIGITGKNGAGKTKVAEYLSKKGFFNYSLSDRIREEATKRRLEHSRSNLTKLGNDLRKKFGFGYLARQINKKIDYTKASSKKLVRIKNENFFVIDSVRSPYEVRELRKNDDFFLVGISAPTETRFKRLLKRNRLGDAKTLEEFEKQEQIENLNKGYNQQLDLTISLANKIITNDSTLEKLYSEVKKLVKELNNNLASSKKGLAA